MTKNNSEQSEIFYIHSWQQHSNSSILEFILTSVQEKTIYYLLLLSHGSQQYTLIKLRRIFHAALHLYNIVQYVMHNRRWKVKSRTPPPLSAAAPHTHETHETEKRRSENPPGGACATGPFLQLTLKLLIGRQHSRGTLRGCYNTCLCYAAIFPARARQKRRRRNACRLPPRLHAHSKHASPLGLVQRATRTNTNETWKTPCRFGSDATER